MFSSLISILLGKHFFFHMAEESVTTVVVENPGEEVPEEKDPTVAEQAAEIVDTAKDLAKEISKSDEMISLMLAAVMELQNTSAAVRDELVTALSAINVRLDSILEAIDDVEGEVIVEAVKPVESPAEEVAAAAGEVAMAAAQVVETDAEKPQKRSRKWL